MSGQSQIIDELKQLDAVATAGFALAFHINYTRPTFLFQTYPDAWISEYSEKGLVMSDPTVHWGFENEGTQRWSALASQDTGGVLKMAAIHGLNYGVTCTVEAARTRSMGSFARADREFGDDECAALLTCIDTLHHATSGLNKLSDDLLADLEANGIRVSHPGGQ